MYNYISYFIVPSSVSIISTDIGNSNISLQWNEPLHHRKCVKDYKVEIKGPHQRPAVDQKKFDTVTEDTYTTFEDLDPCGKYNYTIIPISNNGSLGEPFTEDFVTLEGSKYYDKMLYFSF